MITATMHAANRRYRMIDLAGCDKLRELALADVYMLRRDRRCPVDAHARLGWLNHVLLEQPPDLRPDGVRRPLSLFEKPHGNDAARIDGAVGDADSCRNALIMPARNKRGVVVRDDCSGLM